MSHRIQVPDDIWRRSTELAGDGDPEQFLADVLIEAYRRANFRLVGDDE